ncbi:xanthine dehydrogenase subunit D [uncultured Rummeliibacillus sp.]|uniref:xanthine dehydrogenase subunit D n=1 Tax=uncultured Rummeliibacillus sp. TaxID=762292 RepID=UPI002624E9A7|nr:xanthine dehydrogenase subunit D [uncultured Rummeliibacillus sp.]
MKSNLIEKKDRIRPDGLSKVTGDLKYLTDLTFPNMLYGKVLRSKYPHAKILSINTEKAESIPGVEAVITHKDVPGMNRFGIIIADQPVFCEDRVRYIGDAIAAVAAESFELAEEALKHIEVVYEELPILDSPDKALESDAIRLHPAGNICSRSSFRNGDVQQAFEECVAIVEETYELPRQLHGYMETEGGVVVPEDDGGITVYAATQHGFKDRFQISRILGIPESMIRIVSSPIGGSFGGKDEQNIQPYASLLALATKKPVKIHNTREESIRASIKRHPMKITVKTGTDATGKILAHQVKIIADKGAYTTLGPAVLDFAVEHAAGPYMIPNIETEGVSVYTNNGVSGEFRGFGGNQITFALEGQMDRLAEVLKMDPIEIRKKNLRTTYDLGPMGHRIAPTDGAALVLEKVQELSKLPNKDYKESPWKRYGTGIAITMHGGGLGFGRLDSAGGRISLNKQGEIEISFGFEECGQGLLSVIENLVIEEIGCSQQDVKIVIGDTSVVPLSGSSTASRGTSIVWQSLQKMKGPFKEKICKYVSDTTSIHEEELYLGPNGIWQVGKDDAPCMTYKECAEGIVDQTVLTSFHFPVTPDAVNGGHFLYTFGGVKVEVEVDLLTGKVKILALDHVVSAGPVVSPKGYIGQIEGGGVMSLGYTLMEEVKMIDGQLATTNFDAYLMPNIVDVPFETNVHAIEDLVEGDPYGPRGVGEIGTIAIIPAVVKAVHDAIGCWVSKLPISSEEILENIESKGMLTWI